MQQGSCGPVSWGVGAWLGPKPQGVFGFWLRRPGMGSRRLVYVRACPSLGAHILVPVGTRLEMGLPGQLMLEGGLVWSGGPCSILILFARMPVVLGVGQVGFLPVVPSLPCLPGCKPPRPPNPGALTSASGHSAQQHLLHSPRPPESPSPPHPPPWSFPHTPCSC